MPLRQETQQAYIQGQINELKRVVDQAEGDDAMTVKRALRTFGGGEARRVMVGG
ncbi:hypothetical protein FHX68_1106 [Microbacterium lacticum]|uniref:Uncharacterized protein n=1 Tax=Microbacterium lacticum TaxID=33885 RepID=A0A543L0W8_9MICO|nr:hypothetical protein [Microbacterium lacticum]TQN00973.1 hypothetical protein FHX68_1106 [Microbacterium lacticum]GGI74875.1 hypothetical protein GCM10009724_27250 [Microbacterium lacticum]